MFNTKKKITIFMFSIIAVAFILRFWNLGSHPALNADEAAIGYNAYALLQTGNDEHGNSWPIHFQSFNDYKPGLYVYLVLPFIKLLGLNEWAVRLPNAILGVATVYLLYLFIRQLRFENSSKVGLVAAFMLAISPWHIHFSRGGWEVNTSTFFTLFGTILFIKFVSNNKRLLHILFLSVLSYSLAIYSYHAARIIVPLIVFGLIGIYFGELKVRIKEVLIAGLFGIVCLLPLAKDMLRPEISSRAAGVGLFADVGPLNRINEQRGEHADYNSLFTKFGHNKPVNYSLSFLENWLAHYHGLFLFLSGDDIQRNKVPETGQMYLFDIMFILVGIIWMTKNITKGTRLIFHWLVIAPFAAALTFQSPHALRAENMVIPLVVISALGFVYLLDLINTYVKNRNGIYFSVFLIIGLMVWQFARYQHMYWIHMSKEYPYSSQYGVKELVQYLENKKEDRAHIVVTTKYDQPYILFLFFTKYPPSKFQGNHELTGRDEFGFSTVQSFGNYVFKHIDLGSDKIDYPGSLLIGTEEEIPDYENIIKRINGTNGVEYFRVLDN